MPPGSSWARPYLTESGVDIRVLFHQVFLHSRVVGQPWHVMISAPMRTRPKNGRRRRGIKVPNYLIAAGVVLVTIGLVLAGLLAVVYLL